MELENALPSFQKLGKNKPPTILISIRKRTASILYIAVRFLCPDLGYFKRNYRFRYDYLYVKLEEIIYRYVKRYF